MCDKCLKYISKEWKQCPKCGKYFSMLSNLNKNVLKYLDGFLDVKSNRMLRSTCKRVYFMIMRHYIPFSRFNATQIESVKLTLDYVTEYEELYNIDVEGYTAFKLSVPFEYIGDLYGGRKVNWYFMTINTYKKQIATIVLDKLLGMRKNIKKMFREKSPCGSLPRGL